MFVFLKLFVPLHVRVCILREFLRKDFDAFFLGTFGAPKSFYGIDSFTWDRRSKETPDLINW